MKDIKPGDMVQLVFACCALGRRHIGWTGIAESVEHLSTCPCYCGYSTLGMHALVDIGGRGYVPLSWLVKVEPPAKCVERVEREELLA